MLLNNSRLQLNLAPGARLGMWLVQRGAEAPWQDTRLPRESPGPPAPREPALLCSSEMCLEHALGHADLLLKAPPGAVTAFPCA